uniref:Rho-GAP domain-containing protein n=1 Tax=Panagrolaimus sp. ES5 TaxID=591445 RepID=A0AC34FDF8_9BILA
MAPPPPPKLCTTESENIAREFINNWSHHISLFETNSEQDVIELLALLESVRVKWQKSEAAANHYKQKLEISEKHLKEAVKEQNRLKDLYLNCQSQLNQVSNSKEDIEEELKGYKNQSKKLKSIIKDSDQAFISDGLLAIINNKVQRCHSVSGRRNSNTRDVTTRTQYRNEETEEISVFENGPSDIDFDKTGDTSMESSTPKRSTRKRCSATSKSPQPRSVVQFEAVREEEIPTKRCRNVVVQEDDIEITARIRIDSARNQIQQPYGYVKIRRSKSESNVCRLQKEIINIKPKAMTPHFNAGSTFSISRQIPQAYAGSWTRGQEIERRTHRVKTFSSVFENCDVCAKHLIAKNALKYCNVRFHRHCQSGAPMPCVPKVPIPKTPSRQQKCSLVQYCPEAHPFIPPILIHCIIALERDRLSFEGIYRISGSTEAVKTLYKEFMSNRKIPNLSKVETENITGCIKMFLRELRDSVIPSTSYDDFIKAIEANNEQRIIDCVFELPAPNRDTLAYLILHLQKISNNSVQNKMNIQNLATVLCPTVVGYSKLVTLSLENSAELTRNQYTILYRLLKIPSEFWRRFIENNMSAVIAAEARTPGSCTPLLTVTPSTTTPTQTSSTSKNETPKLPKKNNNQFLLELEAATTSNAGTASPIIQPLSLASKSMRGINFKPAL